MECFDISHASGESTVASCVVFDAYGPVKSDYRRFNIEGITGGDDFAAMKQALTRRYQRLQRGDGTLPELLVIDGGKGQLTQAMNVLEELGVSEVMVLGIAKGASRKSGFEQVFIGRAKTPIAIDASTPGFHLLQHIRDEAHRFAVTGHRHRRDKKTPRIHTGSHTRHRPQTPPGTVTPLRRPARSKTRLGKRTGPSTGLQHQPRQKCV